MPTNDFRKIVYRFKNMYRRCDNKYINKAHTKAELTSANKAGLFCSTARRHVISAPTYSDWHK